ncbi:MAG: nitrite reductase small subunit NirD [Rhodobacteraceae bacterium]|nr:nitrite reductase small subunit NirD [Paracoccaceae bacterium]
MTDWIDIGALDDIPPRGARTVTTPFGCVAVFRTGDDRVFALSNRCPHKGGPLAEGIVHGHSVTCPLHSWVFDLASGEAQGADTGRVETFPARLEGGRVLLDVAALRSRPRAA